MNTSNQISGLGRASWALSRGSFASKAVWLAGITLLLVIAPSVSAQDLASPDFANPPEVPSRRSEKTLRMIMELTSGKFLIPNVRTESMRQFRGWDPAKTKPDFGTVVSPGPTLRARLGDRVEISFFNKINDGLFDYTFVTPADGEGKDIGCDKAKDSTRDANGGIILPYPAKDTYPNCFHGSSTANIHFHGTHTTPDGLGDNVLVQVLPQPDQPNWSRVFDQIFSSREIPQKWLDLPAAYRDKQMELLRQHDKDAKAGALKNHLDVPKSLADANQSMIDAGRWPQYIIGAFPNFFEIPDYSSNRFRAGQAPGTHWYHAHKHGSTSLHMINGLAGAFVIESSQEGGYDHFIRNFYGWGNSYGKHENIFVLQEFDPTQNLLRSPRAAGGPPNPGKGLKQVLINAKLTPTIKMAPGDVQLWRFVNATPGNVGGGAGLGVTGVDLFQTQGFNFRQTAMDGVQFSPHNYTIQPFLRKTNPVPGGLALAAGNRADVLVQAPGQTGSYTFTSNGKTLFFVKVEGSKVTLPNGAFPTDWAVMPKFLHDLPAPTAKDKKNPDSPVKFQWEANRPGPGLLPATPKGFAPHYMINDKQFEDNGPRVDQCMPLNGLQDWILENYTTVAHPFHIHINPFQVIRIQTPTAQNKYATYAPRHDRVWQDVIAIPAAKISANGKRITPGRVVIRQTYLDYTGTYVLHCHILAHEDRGMMQLVRVVPAKDYRKGCQDHIPDHH